MPLVRIDLVGGRRPELLRALIANVHRTVVDTLQVPPAAVTVIVDEHPAELWATAGVTKAEQRTQADHDPQPNAGTAQPHNPHPQP